MEEETRVTKIRPEISQLSISEDACLVFIYPPGPLLGKRFALAGSQLVIGRGQDCDIMLDRDAVSRRHARVERAQQAEGGWRVVDLDSTNGSYVNDVQIRDHLLKDGDRLKIGNAIFKFLTGGNVETAYHEEIYRMTIIDGLAQVYNKRYFVEQLERELARAGRNKRVLSLLVFDLDDFKQINDTHGHLTGDHVLREMAARVKRRIRRDEIFARCGGDEFAVVLPEATREQALQIADQIRKLITTEPFVFEQVRIPLTISCGVATVSEDIPVSSFIRMADEALYKAKREGRDRVVAAE